MFRVEVLHAHRLPWGLLRPVAAIFQAQEPALFEAGLHYLRGLADHLDFLRGVDYKAELEKVLVKHDWEGSEDWTRDDLERGTYAGWLIQSYEDTYGLLNESFFSLAALGFLASGVSRAEILGALSSQSWATKHEILARWGWMGKQREMLQAGSQLKSPYMCVVPRRKRNRRDEERILAREFYQLLLFLHQLRATSGEELLFVAKGETPDFVLEDAQGKRVGAEMTTASISDAWDEECDAQDEVIEAIVAQVEGKPLSLHIREPQSWSAIADRLSDLGDWLRSELTRIAIAKEATMLTNSDLALTLEISSAEEPLSHVLISGTRGVTGDDIKRVSQNLQATLRHRIETKIERRHKSGKIRTRPKPAKRPCHLVIYPNHDMTCDLDVAVHDFFQHPPIDVRSHFDTVWLSNETRLIQLM